MELLYKIIEENFVAVVGAVSVLVTMLPYLLYQKLQSDKVKSQIARAESMGLREPVTIHPKVDRGRCMGSGACVKACPEKSVLGMVENKSSTVCASECVGHGACVKACPVGAIELVFGSERRGVDIPDVNPRFETNVPRIYIAGELGGMGLIKNSVLQGQEAVQYINEDLKENQASVNGAVDLVIVGAGPSGLAATLQAKKERLKSITIEREDELGGALLSYPRAKVVMTSPMVIPLYGKVKRREISKEQLMDLWDDVQYKTGIKVSTSEALLAAEDAGEYFDIKTSKREIKSRYILLCIGRRGVPRKLGVPGEKSNKVMYRLLDPERFAKQKILVVGGGDSAVEAAITLAEQPGTKVTLSYRGEAFARIKPMNRKRLEEVAAARKLGVILNSNVLSIEELRVIIDNNGTKQAIPNDSVFIFAGGEAPNEFLKKVGVAVETKYGTR